jgi:tetratricopeptide (TPR) repeat protein
MNPDEKKVLVKIERARNAYLKNDYAKSVELYKWVEGQIQDDPINLPIIWIELGWSYYNLRDFKNSILYLEKSLTSSQLTVRQQFDCLRLIGFSHGALKDSKNSLRFLKEALKKDIPETEKKYVNFEVGKIHFLTGALQKSETYFESAARFFTWEEADYFQSIRYYQGLLAFYKKEYEYAERAFAEIVENARSKENKATGYFGMAHLLYQKQNYGELLVLCEKIMELDKNFYDGETVAFFLCKSFMELNRLKELTIFYNELKNRYPNGRYHSYYPAFEKILTQAKPSRQNNPK